MKESVLRFPQDRSIGTLSTRKSASRQEWIEYAPACGEIAIPDGLEVQLSIDPRADFDPALFSEFEPEALAVFEWVSTSKVSDAAIKHLQHLIGLKGIAYGRPRSGTRHSWALGGSATIHWAGFQEPERIVTNQRSVDELLLSFVL